MTTKVEQGCAGMQPVGAAADKTSVGNGSGDLTPSSKRHPCPICGRQKDGDCRIGTDLVLCHHGSSHHPPEGLRPGDTTTGSDGQQWAFTGDSSDGRTATYVLHKPREGSHPPTSLEAPTRGAENSWRYSDSFIVCRFPGKKIRPLSWDGERWLWRAPKSKRPLLNLSEITSRPEARVLVVEGEKTCDAAARLFPGSVATTWSGGCKALHHTDLSPLAGRKVVLWPDNDEPGHAAMERLAGLLQQAGAASVKVVANPPDVPEGWDLADAQWSPQEAAEWAKNNITEAPPARTEQQQGNSSGQTKREPRPRKLSHTRAMACFDRCVEVQAKRERNSLRRRARLLKAANDLGLGKYLNRQEIAQRVLEAKDRQQGHGFKALTAADRAAMAQPVVRWQIPMLLPANDLTILGGRPKVGKTRLAIAMAAAVILGVSFLGMPEPTTTAPVVLVTDDQSDADSAEMLKQLGIWDHPRLLWSRHFRLTENDLDQLLATVKANPGALVIIDSLRSISRSLQHGENDPEIGATLYDLKQAVIDAGGTLLLIHHCNKAADLVGTEALSGHNAIAGAANTVITLHYCPDAKDRPDKENPQRRMFKEGRSGDGCDVVIDRGGGGSFRLVSTFGKWQQQLAEARKQQKHTEELTPTQQELLDRLEADPGQFFTRRQLVEELGLDWADGRGSDAVRVRESLQKLARLQLIQKERSGREWVFAALCGGQKQSSPSSPSSPSSDGNGSEGEDQGEGVLSFLSFQSPQGVSAPSTAPATTTTRAPASEGEEGEDGTSPCDPLARQEGEEGEHVEARSVGGAVIPGFVDPSPQQTGSSWDSGDGDDPHWPKRAA